MSQQSDALGPRGESPKIRERTSTVADVGAFRAAEFPAEIAEVQTADADRLLALYNAGLAPIAAVEQKYIAMKITLECNGFANPRVYTRALIASIPGLSGSPQFEVVARAVDVKGTRCAALDSLGHIAWKTATTRLIKDLSAPGSPFSVIRITNQDGTLVSEQELLQARQHLRDALNIYGLTALDWTGDDLVRLATIDKDRKDHGVRANYNATSPAEEAAVALIPCLSGQPCGASILRGLRACVDSGGDANACGDNPELWPLPKHEAPVAVSDSDKLRAKVLAKDIVEAVAARNWPYLGL